MKDVTAISVNEAVIDKAHLMRMLAINAVMITNAHDDITVLKVLANAAAFANDANSLAAYYHDINKAKRFIAATAKAQVAIKRALRYGKRPSKKHNKNNPRYTNWYNCFGWRH